MQKNSAKKRCKKWLNEVPFWGIRGDAAKLSCGNLGTPWKVSRDCENIYMKICSEHHVHISVCLSISVISLVFFLEYLIICKYMIIISADCQTKLWKSHLWALGNISCLSPYFDFWTSWKGTIIWSPFRLSGLQQHFLKCHDEIFWEKEKVCLHLAFSCHRNQTNYWTASDIDWILPVLALYFLRKFFFFEPVSLRGPVITAVLSALAPSLLSPPSSQSISHHSTGEQY